MVFIKLDNPQLNCENAQSEDMHCVYLLLYAHIYRIARRLIQSGIGIIVGKFKINLPFKMQFLFFPYAISDLIIYKMFYIYLVILWIKV